MLPWALARQASKCVCVVMVVLTAHPAVRYPSGLQAPASGVGQVLRHSLPCGPGGKHLVAATGGGEKTWGVVSHAGACSKRGGASNRAGLVGDHLAMHGCYGIGPTTRPEDGGRGVQSPAAAAAPLSSTLCRPCGGPLGYARRRVFRIAAVKAGSGSW